MYVYIYICINVPTYMAPPPRYFGKSTPALHDDGDVALEPLKKKKTFSDVGNNEGVGSSTQGGLLQSLSKDNHALSSTARMPNWR